MSSLRRLNASSQLFGWEKSPHSRIPQRFGEGIQLAAQPADGKTGVLKGKPVLEALSHEERLSDTPPAVYSNELRILVVNG
jgi:hypothetical protein